MGDRQKTKSLAEQFKYSYYSDGDSVELLSKNGDRKCIHLENPVTLTSFVAFCSKSDRKVFLRGETECFPHSVPSLFRNSDGTQCGDDELRKRWSAFQCFRKELRK